MSGRSPQHAADTVRAATTADVAVIGRVQARAFRAAYADLLDAEALRGLDGGVLDDAWLAAVSSPPSPRHAVLVAIGPDGVVGFAAVGPGSDPDATGEDGELAVLAVDPGHQRAGHGSRLLAAAAEHLRRHRLRTVRVWTPDADAARRAFLTSAGLLEDGARREHRGARGERVAEIRLSARLDDDG